MAIECCIDYHLFCLRDTPQEGIFSQTKMKVCNKVNYSYLKASMGSSLAALLAG